MGRLGTLARVTVDAVLFDFSGTLFRLEDDESWAADLITADGRPMDANESAEILRRMTTPIGQSVRFDEAAQYAWDNRDLDSELHRKAYLEVLRQSGLAAERAERLYARSVDPDGWTPYPDTGKVLEGLATRGIPVAVVSNIAFDFRPAFVARGWDPHVAAFALSYEIGAVKPDPRIFEWALERVGARNALMVGDSAEADGAATAIGCEFALVDPLPTFERRTGLLDALAPYGLL
ncbi:HAD family hydrolase [Nocardia pseudobrasiliensis]|uniref:HAD superfamily hydrolase (TIGR01549 family) n=1 Tax=Nocardia pseudobrasiliensis TaxID=45979 RepID=A0A370I9D0_9NOCA|nr:HAD-IA family hydrolase [Nocardia pseudobrasiliensis]RDI67323.1 HAD superfamily hydrolase (TIGR01549 family) [Nocardia pseudobrasiliensis]